MCAHLLRGLELEDGPGDDVLEAGCLLGLPPGDLLPPGGLGPLGALQGQTSRPDQVKVYFPVETWALVV